MDFNNDTEIAAAPARMSKLLDDVFTNDPGVTVLVGTLIPRRMRTFKAASRPTTRRCPGWCRDKRTRDVTRCWST